jgi:hypothetical protein
MCSIETDPSARAALNAPRAKKNASAPNPHANRGDPHMMSPLNDYRFESRALKFGSRKSSTVSCAFKDDRVA